MNISQSRSFQLPSLLLITHFLYGMYNHLLILRYEQDCARTWLLGPLLVQAKLLVNHLIKAPSSPKPPSLIHLITPIHPLVVSKTTKMFVILCGLDKVVSLSAPIYLLLPIMYHCQGTFIFFLIGLFNYVINKQTYISEHMSL